MTLKNYSEKLKTTRCSTCRLLFVFIFIVCISAVFVEACLGGVVTFAWQANPVEDDVVGYRLYYGADSRFNSDGTLKTSFSYDYYIDFAERRRCDASSGGTSCVLLSSEELQCENLYYSVPQCTVSNLYGQLYFSLTAYNAQEESNFTRELSMAVTPEGFNPQGQVIVPQIISILLLNK